MKSIIFPPQNINHDPKLSDFHKSNKPLRVLLDGELINSIFVDSKFSQSKATLSLLGLVFSREVNCYMTDIDLANLELLSRKRMTRNSENFMSMIEKYFIRYTLTDAIIHKSKDFNTNCFSVAIAVACTINEPFDAIIIGSNKIDCAQAFVSQFRADEISIPPILLPEEFLRRYSMDNKRLEGFGSIKSHISVRKLSDPLEVLESHLKDEENLYEIFDGWSIEHFEVHIATQESARATVTLWSSSEGRNAVGQAYGNGPAHALLMALNEAVVKTKSHYQLPKTHIISLESSTFGTDSPVNATVTVRVNNKEYQGFNTHNDTVKAVFYAYLDAIRKPKDIQFLKTFTNDQILSCHDLCSQYNLGQRNFSEIILQDLSLSGVSLRNIQLDRATINFGDYRRIDLGGHRSNLSGIRISNANLEHANLEYADLSNCEINRTKLSEANFFHTNLDRSRFCNTELIRAKMNKASLKNADLSSNLLEEVVLDNANLTDANLFRANLTNANLNEANLTRTFVNGAKFDGAQLTKTRLDSTNFSRASLVSVNFNGSELISTNFSEANLTRANLQELDLTKSDLGGAILDYANLLGAKIKSSQIEQLGGCLHNVNLSQANIDD